MIVIPGEAVLGITALPTFTDDEIRDAVAVKWAGERILRNAAAAGGGPHRSDKHAVRSVMIAELRPRRRRRHFYPALPQSHGGDGGDGEGSDDGDGGERDEGGRRGAGNAERYGGGDAADTEIVWEEHSRGFLVPPSWDAQTVRDRGLNQP